jgi:hypothetical protein
VVVIGGLLGTDRQWEAFANAWEARLAYPLADKPSLKQFHLTHCRAGQGEFIDYSPAERDLINYVFRQIIIESGLVSVAVAVNKAAWDELVVGEVARQLGSPLQLCFFKCMEEILRICREQRPGQKVDLCFDIGIKPEIEEFASYCEAQNETTYPELGIIYYAPVPKVVALQGADMIALETYQYGEQWFERRWDAVSNPHFRDFISRDLSRGIVYDYDQIEEMVARTRV